ncbi:sensor domain-containing protein [Mycolicibacterium moriokaense]|nr:sensor domain-containing protein [Mycolicibacterium moriokaense]
MTRAVPVLTLCVAVVFGAMTTACTSVVQGSAVKAASSVPADDVPPLEESALDTLMLSNSDLNKIAGVEMESFYSAEEMNDNADLVSDLDCLGAVYPGEDAAYDGARWTAIRDELLLAAGSDSDSKLLEQTVVLFDTHDDAVEFFDGSKEKWRECAQAEDIEVEDGPWVPQSVQDVDERTMSLKAEVSGTLEGICQHAMGVVSNLIVEGFSCDADDNDDAQKITTQLLEDAADQ